MDRLAPYLDWLVEHRFAAVFVASLIDATGLPFPGRIVLLVLGMLVNATGEFFLLVLASTAGSVLGDHVGSAASARTESIPGACRSRTRHTSRGGDSRRKSTETRTPRAAARRT